MRGLREQLVERLRASGVIRDPAIARAFAAVPRHRFVPEVPEEKAYADEVVPTKHDEYGHPISSASQPSMVALMLRQLDLRPGLRVLEIGAGTGYNAALLAELVGPNGQVTTVDIDADTVARAAGALAETGYAAVRAAHVDGGHGLQEFAPYDRIVVTAGAADLPPAWWRQLVPDGLLVVPLRLSGIDVSIAFRRRAGATPAQDRLVSRSLVGCGFMPMRGEFGATGGAVELADSGVRAVYEGERALDAAALRSAYQQPTLARSVGVSRTVDDASRELELWLATTDPLFCRIDLDADAVGAGALPAPLVAPNGRGRAAALLRQDGFAVLTYAPTPPDSAPESGTYARLDEPDQRVELGVRGYGPGGPELCSRLTTGIREWNRRGTRGLARMRVVAVPAGTEVVPSKHVLIVDKPHCRLLIRWH